MRQVAGFFRGFFLTLLAVGCIVGGLYSLAVAETNTRRVGFGDPDGSVIFYYEKESGRLRVFGQEITLLPQNRE